MTHFEYLVIAFALLLSFAGMRLIGGLPHAVQSGRRYWVHILFICWQLLITIGIFWVFWTFRNVNWNFPTFLLVLASPGLIYYNACILIPENPSAVESWHAYYYSVRRRYFVGVSCWGLVVATISTVALGMPLLHPARGLQAATLVVGVTGALSASHRVQAGIAVFVLTFSVFISLTLGLQPGSFAPS